MEEKKENALAALTTDEFTGLMYSPLAAELSKPFSRQIFLTHVRVAGCNHVDKFEEYLSELSEGDRLILLREPQNEHDELAILVKDQKNRKLGYVPRAHNHVMARLMDAGKLLYAEVTRINGPEEESYPWTALVIAIYMED